MSARPVNNLSTLVRPRFGPGMLLHHEDLEQLGDYTRDLSRLLFRSFFGCGVVCGLEVVAGNDCGKASITVQAGLAINCSGDPIHVPRDVAVTINEACDPNPQSPLWVILCRTVKCCAPRTSMCAPDEDDRTSTCTRDREGYEIRVVAEEPKCACRCDPEDPKGDGKDNKCACASPTSKCHEAHYQGECGCRCGDCSGGGCDCVVLARIDAPKDVQLPWTVDHRARRFIRPVLMRDPLADRRYAAAQGEAAVVQGRAGAAQKKGGAEQKAAGG